MKYKFQIQCPGCQDKHLGVECKKPTFLTTTMVNTLCDNCNSRTLVRVTLPRGPEYKRGQVRIEPIKITPSHKLMALLEARKTLEDMAKQSEPVEIANE